MATTNMNFNPVTDIALWGGGIDSTLGVYLLIQQHGADNVVINTHAMRVTYDMYNDKRPLPFYVDLATRLGVKGDLHTVGLAGPNDRRYRWTTEKTHKQYKEIYSATGRFNPVRFNTETNTYHNDYQSSREIENWQYVAHMIQDIIGDNIQSYAPKSPFFSQNVDRGEVLNLYVENNIQDLLPLTRSCSIGLGNGRRRVTDMSSSTTKDVKEVSGDVTITEQQFMDNVHCGVCPKCLKRKYGFKSVGMTDPTIYIR